MIYGKDIGHFSGLYIIYILILDAGYHSSNTANQGINDGGRRSLCVHGSSFSLTEPSAPCQ